MEKWPRAPLFALVCCSALFMTGSAQTAAPAQTADANAPDIATHEAPAEFKTRVNLVSVPVVVRDNQSHAVGNLTKDDFQLFDSGKPQVISRFSVEKSGGQVSAKPPASKETITLGGGSPEIPDHFVAYLFDDLHMTNADVMQARIAAGKVLDESFPSSERAAVLTTSGQNNQDFTDDRAKLHEALNRLQSRSRTTDPIGECPYVSYYMADAILNRNDPLALQAGEMDAEECNPVPKATLQQYEVVVRGAAQRTMGIAENDVRIALNVLGNVVRRTGAMPGQRTVVFVSEGFITPLLEREVAEIIDRAIHVNVIVSALDARGLYVPSEFGDISQSHTSAEAERIKSEYSHLSDLAQGELLGEVAEGTGGSVVQNSNDLVGGFRRLAAAPEYFYLLAFTPRNLQPDGKFHRLKVTLTNARGLTVQARHGYFSPRHNVDPAEQTRQEIEEAVFSREDIKDIPFELHTQFFKTTDVDARLAVLAHIDLKHLRFRKADGRNRNDLTVVSALFDHDGNYLTGSSKTVTLRLRDETLESRLNSGITVRTNFDVKIGSYLVRLVLRDAEGQMMSAGSDAIEIP